MTRRSPSRNEVRAVEIGANELHALLEWRLRDRPRALGNLRKNYRHYCLQLYTQLQSTFREPRRLRSAA